MFSIINHQDKDNSTKKIIPNVRLASSRSLKKWITKETLHSIVGYCLYRSEYRKC